MQTIRKYPLQELDENTVLMPTGAKMLSVQVQNGRPYIWALVDTDKATEAHQFRTVGTEWDINLSRTIHWHMAKASIGMALV